MGSGIIEYYEFTHANYNIIAAESGGFRQIPKITR